MTILVLDATAIGHACNPRGAPAFQQWFETAVRESDVVIPAPAEFEVRRELLRIQRRLSVARLNRLVRELRYEEMTLVRWRQAAQLWADARNRGRPTAAPDRLDVDVLVAAIAQSITATEPVVVVTNNVRHLSQFVDARLWTDITFPAADSPPPPDA
jgi:predicted nucleic acid-binding protein